MAEKNISILFIEDSEDDVLLLLDNVRRGGFHPSHVRVETGDDMRRALDYTEWDLIISDHQMPHFDSVAAMDILKESGKEIPFIIISGLIDEDAAVVAMRSGAHDFIKKGNLKRLVPAIERELADNEERKKRRKMELAVQKSEARYRMLFDKTMDGFALFEEVQNLDSDPADFLFLEVNDAFETVTGMARNNVIGKTLGELSGPDGDESIEHFIAVVRTGDPDHFEYSSALFGRYMELSVYRPRQGLVASLMRDISIKKIAAERLEMTSYMLQTINRENDTQTIIQDILSLLKYHYSFDAVALRLKHEGDYPYFLYDGFPEDFIEAERNICVRNEQGKIILDEGGNPRMLCLCGMVISGHNGIAKTLLSKGGSFWTNNLGELMRGAPEGLSHADIRGRCQKEGYESVALIPLKSGEETIGLLQFNNRRKNAFTPDLIEFFESVGLTVGIALKRRWHEDEIRKSEERYRQVFDIAADGMFLIDRDTGRIMDANAAACAMYGYSLEEMLSMRNVDLSAEPERTAGALTTGLKFAPLRYHRKKDGTSFPVELTANYFELGGVPVSVVNSRDITVRMQAEEKIMASLREKDVLLKEIHHRVKNNLQVISSLVGLQSMTINAGNAAAAFQDVQNRIKSMAIIHEKLYLSEDFSVIPFGEYVESISQYLLQSFVVDPDKIEFKSDIKGINLGIDAAVPCGLIINELITNALKHAFTGRTHGRVFLSMKQDDDGYILTFKDNGVGLSPAVDIGQTSSLGLRLVAILTQQLKGSIKVRRESGTEFIIRFKEADEHE